MLEIHAQRWLAVLYRCPKCGNQTFQTLLKPSKRNRERTFECQNWSCRASYEIVERRYWTSFCIEANISQTTIAGTLAEFGGWRVCHIVHRNIREFKKWYRQRKREQAEQARQYFERERQIQKECEERRKREAQERALLKEAATIAYRREHAVELAAEQVAQAAWTESDVPNCERTFAQEQSFWGDDDLSDLDELPF